MSINTTYSGILNIDKPERLTSHDVISKVRRIANMRRVGHAGTLDPMATGVLLVMLGNATRLMEYAHDLKKIYRAEITLGAVSDTDDAMGTITPKNNQASLNINDIQKVLPQFIGDINQIPPSYAAIKVKGKKLYEYARKNETVERKPRPVTIYNIEVLSYDYPYIDVRVTCGSGTYIRSLARDIGDKLSTGAYLSKLRREAIGDFTIEKSVQLHDISSNNIATHIDSPRKLLAHLPSVTLSEKEIAKVKQGQSIFYDKEHSNSDQPLALFNASQDLVGIGTLNSTTSLLHPNKILL